MNFKEPQLLRGALLLVFRRLGASTWLAMAAMVCKDWQALALECRRNARFGVSLWDVARCPRLLQWAKKIGLLPLAGTFEADALCIVAAARSAQEALLWLHANSYRLNAWVCNFAVLNGNKDALLWARSVGTPWDETACELAAERGDLALLKFLREQHCPWDDRVVYRALLGRHFELLAWVAKTSGLKPSYGLLLDCHHRGVGAEHAREIENIASLAIHSRPSYFTILYTIPGILMQIFAWLDEPFLSRAACVCTIWRDHISRLQNMPATPAIGPKDN